MSDSYGPGPGGAAPGDEPRQMSNDEDLAIVEPGSEEVIRVAGNEHVVRVGSRSSRVAPRPIFRRPGYSDRAVSPGYLPLAKKSRRRHGHHAVVAANGYRLVADDALVRADLPTTVTPEPLADEVVASLKEARQADADPDWVPPATEADEPTEQAPAPQSSVDERIAGGFWARVTGETRNSGGRATDQTPADQSTADQTTRAGTADSRPPDTLVDHAESDAQLADEILALDPAVRQTLVRKLPMELRVRELAIKSSQRDFLIRDVSFNLKAGELSAIAASDSVLSEAVMASVCGRRAFSGAIQLGGWQLGKESVGALRTATAWVNTQADQPPQSAVSVDEHLWQLVELRQPAKTPSQRRGFLAAVQASLPLQFCGTAPLDSLNAVERHWVALAELVVCQAPINIWDGFGEGLADYQMRSVLEMLRHFAQDGLWTVALVGPTSAAMMRCERAIVLGEAVPSGRGGEVCFDGPPRKLARFFELEHVEHLGMTLRSDIDWPTRWRSHHLGPLTDAGAGLEFSGKGVPTRWASRWRQYTVASRSALGSHLRYAESLWALSVPLVLTWLACLWWFGSQNLAWGSTSAAAFVSAVPVGLSVLMVIAAALFARPLHLPFGQWASGRSAWCYVLGVNSVLYGAVVWCAVLFAAVFVNQAGPGTGVATPWRAAEMLVTVVCAAGAIFGLATLLVRRAQKLVSVLGILLGLLVWLTLTCGGLVNLTGRFSSQTLSVDNVLALVAWTSPTWLASSALGASNQVLHRQPGCAENLVDGCRLAWSNQPSSFWVPVAVLAGIAVVCALLTTLLMVRSVTQGQRTAKSPVGGTSSLSRAVRSSRDGSGYYIQLVGAMVWFVCLAALALCLVLDAFGLFGLISSIDQQVPSTPQPQVKPTEEAPVA